MLESILIPVISLGGIAFVLGLCIVFVSKTFYVQEDPLLSTVIDLLPGANCGGCGYPGCSQFAAALVEKKDPSMVCTFGGPEIAQKIGSALGIQMSETEPLVCTVRCHGTDNVAKVTANYHGIKDCWTVKIAFHGTKICPYGCLGLGSCISACDYGALSLKDGIINVNPDRCTGCGLCVDACPQQVLEMQPREPWKYYVACSSKDKGALTMKYCEVGCIGCKKCEKICPTDAIKVENFCATIDQEKCSACGLCAEVCPTNSIVLTKDSRIIKES